MAARLLLAPLRPCLLLSSMPRGVYSLLLHVSYYIHHGAGIALLGQPFLPHLGGDGVGRAAIAVESCFMEAYSLAKAQQAKAMPAFPQRVSM